MRRALYMRVSLKGFGLGFVFRVIDPCVYIFIGPVFIEFGVDY